MFLLLCLFVVGFVMASVIAMVVGTETTPRVRIVMVVQDLLMFIVPAVAVAVMTSRNPAALLMLCRQRVATTILMSLALIAAVPAMNALVEWNASLPMPEAWREAAQAQQGMIDVLMGGTSVGSLIISILIIGMMGPLAEELIFRGALQRLLASVMGRHAAVWLAATIFSLLHFDMTGFVPRLLLGAGFGYAMIWSGSVWSAVVLHALNNTLTVTAMWLEMRVSPVGYAMQTIGEGNPTIVIASVAVAGLLILAARLTAVRTPKEAK